jgi:pyrroline-5-carboxylate reductase
MTSPHIALFGCGKMGSALLRGWHMAGFTELSVIDPHELGPDLVPMVRRQYRDQQHMNNLPAIDVVVLAVKPQRVADVCRHIKPIIKPDTLILSIAAGRTVSGIVADLYDHQPIIRAMPNTPAAIGHGVTGTFANAYTQPQHRQLAQDLLRAVGKIVWIDDEAMLDAVTALSGSGPAYVFLLIEVMTQAGEKLGLPHDVAQTLARETVIGSAALADMEAATPASTLRQNVTSPGGTTAAALEILNDTGTLQRLFDKALEAARTRARELSH